MRSVDGRQEFLAVMSGAMQGEADERLFGGRLRSGKVKSRLLEAHPPERSPEGSSTLLTEIAGRLGLTVREVDEAFWALLSEDDVFFVDALNPRFWLLHTTASARTLRMLLRRDFLTDSRMDSAWMPSEQLDQLEGVRHWMKSSFVSDVLLPATGNGAQATRRWRVQVEGDAPEELLDLVRTIPRYAAAASLTAVGSFIAEEGIGKVSIIGDYRGAFVASGDNFELVAGALWRTMDRYESYVSGLEQLYRLRTEQVGEAGLSIDGEIAVIDFPVPVRNLEYFVRALFTSKEPFRLWAVPRQIAADEWEANAVDLHVGHTLRLEITPRWMRVLLDERTCGNTLARLVTNLQHRFHAEIRLAPSLELVA